MGKADRLREKKQAMLDEEAVGKPTLTITIEVDADGGMRINGPVDMITFAKMVGRALDIMADKCHEMRIGDIKPEEKRIITNIH